MFNLFKKKTTDDLFKKSNVEYVPGTKNPTFQMKDIYNSCMYHGIKIKCKLGVFVAVTGDEVISEPVIRVEKIGETEPRRGWFDRRTPTGNPVGRPRKKSTDITHKSDKYFKIKEMLTCGKKVSEIASELGVSRQYVYIIKSEKR